MLNWLKQGSPAERRAFWACLGGWSLDAMDVHLFSLVIPALIALWHVSKAEAGLIASVTLIASALGGWLGGALADRIGRVRTLQVTILWFAIATFVSAFTQSFEQLLVVKAFQGLGFGAEWAAGAVLMSETINPAHRGKALGAVQSGWAIGWGAAVLLYGATFSLLPPEVAWRVLFALGLVPALLVLYVRRRVPEPPRAAAAAASSGFGRSLVGIFQPATRRIILIGILFGLGAHGGYYGLFTWLPTFLKTERHLSVTGTGSYLGVIIVAYWLGCVTAGQLLDRLGHRPTVALFAACCVVLTVVYLMTPISPTVMLLLGFRLGFCAAGIPASMATIFTELYPEEIRRERGRVLLQRGSHSRRGSAGRDRRDERVDAARHGDRHRRVAQLSLVLVAVLLLPETHGTAFARLTPAHSLVGGTRDALT